MSIRSLAPTALLIPTFLAGQNLPDAMYLSQDGRILYTNGQPSVGFYDESQVKGIYLTFPQANYWTLLTNNYNSQTPIPATMVYDGVTYDSVAVRFKGSTSYNQLPPGAQKKSFDIDMDTWISGQDVQGYSSLNLNNGFQDNSFMREVIYEHFIRRHIPAARCNFAKLYLNGQNWGPYVNLQGLNGDFIDEWYLSNNGTRWRADRPSGGGGGWGDGTAALNYLGSDTSEYQTYYTLQKANKPNPWDDLVRVCDELNNTPLTALEDTIDRYLDLDRTLWFLACEIAFSDDDSYVFKGKMDYALYWEPETGRITPHEYDGNSVLDSQNLNWAPFYHADNANYPLLNRLLQVQSIRQRYLAHMRTVRSELLATSVTQPVISGYQVLIDTMINNDPKKLMTYTQWQSAITTLQNAMNTRYTTIGNNFEVQQVAPTITTVDHVADGVLNGAPVAGSSVDVRATISGSTYAATLFWSNTIKGRFDRVAMVDDGAHNDGAAGDGVFGGSIPGQSSGTWVRYYIEAASTNAAHSVSYDPPGAEHDVYVYQTQVTPAPVTGVVINEVQSSNSFTAADENGQYEDWIELYNAGGQTVDLSGWYISDTPFDLTKWSIPPGTTIAPDQYLIAWCDEDQSQGAMHTNFKISASGETISLSSADTLLVDQVEVPALSTDQGYARVPNGTGDFVEQEPTFAANNNTVGVVEQEAPVLALFPNPATDQVTVITGSSSPVLVDVSDAMGRSVWRGAVVNGVELPTGHWSSGLYSVVAGGRSQKLVVNSR